MPIKETVNEYRFTDVLLADEYAGWSYGATKALFDYYEQLSEDIGEDIELDHVAMRCEWSEYATALECAIDHGYKQGNSESLPEDSETVQEDALEWLEDRTTVLEVVNTKYDSQHNAHDVTSYLVMQF